MNIRDRNSRFGMVLTLVLVATASRGGEPLKLDAQNPHYLVFRGRPTILVGSSEHYGAVINNQFDYRRYLDTMQASGLNATRIFAGPYHERPGPFGILSSAGIPEIEIAGNTLAPEAEHYLAPWPRTEVMGALDGGKKFDLTRWNGVYFRRLKDFVAEAGRRGIVVEVSLFSNYYVNALGERFWEVSPWNSRNNINGIGSPSGAEALTLKDRRLLAIQDALVRKIIRALHEFDNVYFEICNEPSDTNASLQWQRHIAGTIEAAQATYPSKHLIAQEVGTAGSKANQPLPQASLIAFHNSEGEAVTNNYELNLPIIHNETVFDFTDAANRISAWRFLLSGGALYLGSDYSFTVGHEDGSFPVPLAGGSNGGSATLRRELGVLRQFLESLPFLRMSPQPAIIQSGLPQGTRAYALGKAKLGYAIYFYNGHSEPLKGITTDESPRSVTLILSLPFGKYGAEWLDPKTGSISAREALSAVGGTITVQSPIFSTDIVLRVTSTQ